MKVSIEPPATPIALGACLFATVSVLGIVSLFWTIWTAGLAGAIVAAVIGLLQYKYGDSIARKQTANLDRWSILGIEVLCLLVLFIALDRLAPPSFAPYIGAPFAMLGAMGCADFLARLKESE